MNINPEHEVPGPENPDSTQEAPPSLPVREELDEPALGLRRSDRFFLVTIILICSTLGGIAFLQRSKSGVETVEIRHLQSEEFKFQIDINSATWVEWMQLDGIGETTARNIIADRETNGPFLSISDVQRVKGIGPATLKKMQPSLVCESCDEN